MQALISKWLLVYFHDHFFSRPLRDVLEEYTAFIESTLGTTPDVSHIEFLHRLGYLPLRIKALPEGTMVRDVNTANAKATFVNNIVTVRVMGGSTGFAAPDYSMADL